MKGNTQLRHRTSRALWTYLPALLLLVATTEGLAQIDPWMNELERDAYEAVEEGRYVTARRFAEDLLARNPDSLIGNAVMGEVLFRLEGELAEAILYFGAAREIYETQYVLWPRPEDAPWQFHRQLLFSIQSLAGQLEEWEYQLQVLDFYDSFYEPDLIAEHAWPSLMLGRTEEARDYATQATEHWDEWQRSLGLNSLCAIEGEAREDRQQYYEACLAAFEFVHERESGMGIDTEHTSTLAVHAYNVALAARAALAPELAEEHAVDGTRRLAFTTANPWRFLVLLYTDQGRMEEAVYALREMNSWRNRQPPHLRNQMRAETDMATATAFLVAAEVEAALNLVETALEYPDRRAMTTSTPEQALGAHSLIHRALLLTRAELEAEEASWAGSVPVVTGVVRSFDLTLDMWPDEQRIINVLADEDRLYSTFRLFVRGGLEPLPVWLVGDLIDVLGAGVAMNVLETVREMETDEQLEPYYDGLEAEIALAQGDEQRALSLSQTALEDLPRSETLFNARVAAIGAEAARREDEETTETELFEQVIQFDPSVIRRLGLSIPVELRLEDHTPVAEAAAEMLESSPRLRIGDYGLVLTIEAADDNLQICLSSPTGGSLSCAEPDLSQEQPLVDVAEGEEESEEDEPPPELTDEEVAIRLVEAFHRTAFAMPLGLSTIDMTSLDGTVAVNEQAAREHLEDVLNELIYDTRPTP